MTAIKPKFIETIELLALVHNDFAGQEMKEYLIDLEGGASPYTSGPFEIMSVVIGWAPGASPDSGKAVLIEVFAAPTGANADRYRATVQDTILRPFATAVGNTTVDATSSNGQKELNVAATSNFAVGQTVIIGAGTARMEFGVITAIVAGVSIFLKKNLTYEHTAGDADKVKTWQSVSVPIVPAGCGARVLRVFNEDTDGNDDSIIEITAAGQAGYLTS